MEKKSKKWKRVTDNKMRWYGDTDENKKIIRINKSKKKNTKPGDIIDTIVHEEMHKIHPKMSEKLVRKKTKISVTKLNKKKKNLITYLNSLK